MSDFEKKRDQAADKYATEIRPMSPYRYDDYTTPSDFKAGADWARKEREAEIERLKDQLDKAQEGERFYRGEWQSACERYNYAMEERDALKAEVEKSKRLAEALERVIEECGTSTLTNKIARKALAEYEGEK